MKLTPQEQLISRYALFRSRIVSADERLRDDKIGIGEFVWNVREAIRDFEDYLDSEKGDDEIEGAVA